MRALLLLFSSPLRPFRRVCPRTPETQREAALSVIRDVFFVFFCVSFFCIFFYTSAPPLTKNSKKNSLSFREAPSPQRHLPLPPSPSSPTTGCDEERRSSKDPSKKKKRSSRPKPAATSGSSPRAAMPSPPNRYNLRRRRRGTPAPEKGQRRKEARAWPGQSR